MLLNKRDRKRLKKKLKYWAELKEEHFISYCNFVNERRSLSGNSNHINPLDMYSLFEKPKYASIHFLHAFDITILTILDIETFRKNVVTRTNELKKCLNSIKTIYPRSLSEKSIVFEKLLTDNLKIVMPIISNIKFFIFVLII